MEIGDYFQRYAWAYQVLDDQVWCSTFATEDRRAYDLYVALSPDWIHFAVSPFLPAVQPACRARLYATLLALNQQMRLAYFGLDEDGDVNLLAELPRSGFSYAAFAQTLDTLRHYAARLGGELMRLATEPDYRSPALPAESD
ncbi:type III secretion system chaperone [Litorilinea aerophila]|uniref:Type III secretion system chaperone n=1 Tax=Litorilinea aerophila TaxID=1204385 RepID=A0A540V9J7_9CHLR|nr:YbjN domain-containing protein [Litorilinea aerophila]MCC9078736.1 type III secretion system chaperone [Litorilinea aerophila]OUC05446.1 hypothetical protein RY27_27265 [Litorilinea aerophila]GIV78319.1 MAG: hypothetical protein KatS3mg050_2713 [Litorilinea sp.]